jgi:pimeloyl-ACP methyl ester carboxylesterase
MTRNLANSVSLLLVLVLAPTLAAAGAPTAETVQLKTASGTLEGTLDLPDGKGPFLVLLLLAGSGPTDRDGNQLLMRNDSLKMLGQGLAKQGIAVLRVDKRGIGKSLTPGLKEEDLRFDTYVADAVAWLDLLRKDKRFARVAVGGHSEGALVGMLAATPGKAEAFVSISGAGRDAPTVIREQLSTKLPDDLKKTSNQILDALAQGKTVTDTPKELAMLFRPSVQPYMISWFKHDPAKILARLSIPVLILQGTTDIQVSKTDAELLAAAKKDARLVLLDDVNHVLKQAKTPQDQQAAYTNPMKPIDPRVVDETAKFLKEVLKP